MRYIYVFSLFCNLFSLLLISLFTFIYNVYFLYINALFFASLQKASFGKPTSTHVDQLLLGLIPSREHVGVDVPGNKLGWMSHVYILGLILSMSRSTPRHPNTCLRSYWSIPKTYQLNTEPQEVSNPYGMLDVNIYGHETHGSTRILQEQDSVDRIRKALEEARRWVVHWRLSAVRTVPLEFQGLCDKEMQALESFLQVPYTDVC